MDRMMDTELQDEIDNLRVYAREHADEFWALMARIEKGEAKLAAQTDPEKARIVAINLRSVQRQADDLDAPVRRLMELELQALGRTTFEICHG